MDASAWGIVAVLVVGTAVVAWGWWSDRERNRRHAQAMTRPPERPIPGLAPEAAHPDYLSELQAAVPPDDLPATELSQARRHSLTERLAGARTFPAGWTSRAFVTDPSTGWCVLDDPIVLVCAEAATSVRELLPALERAKLSGRPVVVVAPDASAEVADTLRVNKTQGKLACLLVLLADTGLRRQICSLTGGLPVPPEDLRAGYLPAQALGRCACWVADEDDSWLLLEE